MQKNFYLQSKKNLLRLYHFRNLRSSSSNNTAIRKFLVFSFNIQTTQKVSIFGGLDFMLIDVIAGARPNFMKIAPIIKAIKFKKLKGENIHFRLVHTGQHYDEKMSNSLNN